MAESENKISDHEDEESLSDIEVVPNSVEEMDDYDYYYETDTDDDTSGTNTNTHVFDLAEDVNFSPPESSDDEFPDQSRLHNEIDTLIHDMSCGEVDFLSEAENESEHEVTSQVQQIPDLHTFSPGLTSTQIEQLSPQQENDSCNDIVECDENYVQDINSSVLDGTSVAESGSETSMPNHVEAGSGTENDIHDSFELGNLNANDENNDANDNDENVDLDNLYCRTEEAVDDNLHPLLVAPIEWSETDFKPVYVRGFTGSGQFFFPPDFDTAKASALDYWNLMVTDETLQKIVTNTNLYYKHKLAVKRVTRPDYVDKSWYDLTLPELKSFLGMSFIMGVSGVKRYRYIWSSNKYLRNTGLASVMTLNRYSKISEYLHVSDRDSEIPCGQPGYDKLAKVRWFIDEIHQKIRQLKSPDKNQAIDESIIKFTGRADYKQWNAAKPIRSGFKIFNRCDTNGFCHLAIPYLGRNGGDPPSKMGLYFDIIDKLCRDIRYKNHQVYFDNLYTSVPLIKFLYTKQIYAVGTVRSNKKLLPPTMRNSKQSKLNRGESKFFQDARCSNLVCCLWKDCKDCKIIGSNSPAGVSTNVARRVGHRHIQVQMPIILQKYTQNYGGVDSLVP